MPGFPPLNWSDELLGIKLIMAPLGPGGGEAPTDAPSYPLVPLYRLEADGHLLVADEYLMRDNSGEEDRVIIRIHPEQGVVGQYLIDDRPQQRLVDMSYWNGEVVTLWQYLPTSEYWLQLKAETGPRALPGDFAAQRLVPTTDGGLAVSGVKEDKMCLAPVSADSGLPSSYHLLEPGSEAAVKAAYATEFDLALLLANSKARLQAPADNFEALTKIIGMDAEGRIYSLVGDQLISFQLDGTQVETSTIQAGNYPVLPVDYHRLGPDGTVWAPDSDEQAFKLRKLN